MPAGRTVARAVPATVLVMIVAAALAASAQAELWTAVCVPEKASTTVLSTNAKGECPAKVISKTTVKYKLVEPGKEGPPGPEGKEGKEGKEGPRGKEGPEGKSPFTAEETALLKNVLPFIKYVAEGVGGKPTIQFSGVNVQVVSGAGKTSAAVNGEGNLVIGYDENEGKHLQTGSHNLILGSEQTFTSYGGLLAGFKNAVTAPWASAGAGFGNTASGELSAISGGELNTASAPDSSIGGGLENKAVGAISSVSGGDLNETLASYTWIGGGYKNRAGTFEFGELNGAFSSILGGKLRTTHGEFETNP